MTNIFIPINVNVKEAFAVVLSDLLRALNDIPQKDSFTVNLMGQNGMIDNEQMNVSDPALDNETRRRLFAPQYSFFRLRAVILFFTRLFGIIHTFSNQRVISLLPEMCKTVIAHILIDLILSLLLYK